MSLDLLDDQKLIFDITDVHNHPYQDYDVIVERCINHSRALYSLKILNDQGVQDGQHRARAPTSAATS